MDSNRTDEFAPMYEWAKDLFPLNRSLTGEGVRETLAYLQQIVPELKVREVKSGTEVFDWIVPDEWEISEAYIEDQAGTKIVDFKNCNLHIVGYSLPFEGWVSREELDKHLYSLPKMPDAIPYVTSYYEPRWGFCVSQSQRDEMCDEKYFVKIKANLKSGMLNYGELLIPGKTQEEIFLSTYICHPSMANNELSGPMVTTALGQWLLSLEGRRYSYRIIFVPETIGAITYLAKHFIEMKKRIIAGFVVTCVGDEREYSYLPSPTGKTLADRVAKAAYAELGIAYKTYSFLDRGSDERQYCSPGVDLPVCSLMRSKYHTYPEYHTSLDNLDMISSKGLHGAFRVYQKAIKILEANNIYRKKTMCEPQLGKRKLYPTLSTKESIQQVYDMMNLIAYANGERDLITIAEMIRVDFSKCTEIAKMLESHSVLEVVDDR